MVVFDRWLAATGQRPRPGALNWTPMSDPGHAAGGSRTWQTHQRSSMRARRTAPHLVCLRDRLRRLPSPGGQARPRDPKCAIAYAIASDSIVAVGLSDCAADAVPCGLAWRVLPRLRLRCNRFRGGRIVSVCRVSGVATSPRAKSDDERQVGAPIWGRVLAAVVAVVLTPQRSHRARRLTSVINYPAPRTAEPAHGSAPSPKPRSIP